MLCSVVIAELIYGAERAAPAHRVNNHMRVEQLRQQFVSAPFDDAAAVEYGKVRAHLANLGTPIGPNDLMIAAIVLSCGLMVVACIFFVRVVSNSSQPLLQPQPNQVAP